MQCPEPDVVREWLQTIGTLAAVITALGIAIAGWRREQRRQPKLFLRFAARPDDTWLDLQVLSRPPSAWVRLRISNARGKHSAQDVEVLVTDFRRVSASQDEDPRLGLDIRPLRWSNALDNQGRQMTRVTIPPGVTRYCDLLAVREPSDLIAQAEFQQSKEEVERDIEAGGYTSPAVLQVIPEPTDFRHEITEGTYELEIALCARDVDATFYRTMVRFDGVWRVGSDIWRGLRVDPFKRGRFLRDLDE